MIRKSKPEDLEAMQEIYAKAKAYMRKNGNKDQWNGTYPENELPLKDMENGNGYVIEENGRVIATFAFIIGEDPTYGYIDGKWISDKPYGTIHRIASDGTHGGVLEECLDFGSKLIPHIRIDTHHDNIIMQRLAEKYGFTKCGIIYLENGDPRIAYEKEY